MPSKRAKSNIVIIGKVRVRVKKQIAEGGFSFIFLCQDCTTNALYVLKEMRVQQGNEEMMRAALQDVDMMKNIPAHTNVVRCYATGENQGEGPTIHYHILMEHCAGGSVFDLLQARKANKLSEREVGKIFRDVCSAVVHLHSQDPPIAHRDLKVENVLHDIKHDLYKLCDFGSCTTEIIDCRDGLSRDARLRAEENISKNTTLAYRAPEMVDLYQQKLVNEKVDVWSLGCLLYMLCFNKTPFEDYSGQVERMGILSGRYTIPFHHRYSKGLVALIVRCLEPDPDQRPTSHQVMDAVDKLLMNTTFDHTNVSSGTILKANEAKRSAMERCGSVDNRYSDGHRGGRKSHGRESSRTAGAMQTKWGENDVSCADESQTINLGGIEEGWATFSTFKNDVNVGTKASGASSIVDLGRDNEEAPHLVTQQSPCVDDPFDWFGHNENTRVNQEELHDQSAQASPTNSSDNVELAGAKENVAINFPIQSGRRTKPDGGDTVKNSRSLSIDVHSAKVKAAIGETVRAGVLRIMGGNKQRLWVLRATSSTPGAPKPKYVRQLVIDAWEVGSLSTFQEHIAERPIYKHPVVALKSCIVWLKLLQQGPPEISLDNFAYTAHMESMVEAWARISGGGPLEDEERKAPPLLAMLIHRVSVLISQKLYFHHENPQFDAHYTINTDAHSLEIGGATPMDKHDREWEGEVNIVSRLLTMLSTIDQLQQMAASEFGRVPSSASRDAVLTARPLLLPLVQEAWGVYSGLTTVLTNLRQRILEDPNHGGGDVFEALTYQYFEQREALRVFLEGAQEEPEVTRFHTVPVMKSIPPVIGLANIMSPQYCQEDSSSAKPATAPSASAPSVDSIDSDGGSWANFMSGQSDDWSSLVDETVSHKMLSSRDGRDHLKKAVLAAFKEHEETDEEEGVEDDEESDLEVERGAVNNDPFDLHLSMEDHGVQISGTGSRVHDLDFKIFESATTSRSPSAVDDDSAWAPVSFGSNKESQGGETVLSLFGNEISSTNADAFLDATFLPCETGCKQDNTLLGLNEDANAVFSCFIESGLTEDGVNQKHALTPSDTSARSRDGSLNPFSSKNFRNFFGDKENSDDKFVAYIDYPGESHHGSHGSDGNRRSNDRKASADDAARRSEIALARLIENVQLAGIEILFSDITPGRRVGSGAFAVVYEGTFRGMSVAVKHLQLANINEKVILDFHTEVAMIKSLRHPNIVHAMGACIDPICLITEFCSRGSLFDLLQNRKLKLTWKLRLKLAMDAARGMRFLHAHKPTIIHRDLKSLNLLVDKAWTLKVTDFGLSRFKSPQLMTGQCGTFQWMAPEVVASKAYTEKADVYSFGINLWELWTRKVPYRKLHPMQVAVAVMSKGKRPDIPDDMPRQYRDLMEACWHQKPEKRPPFTEILDCLKAISRQHEAENGGKSSGDAMVVEDAVDDIFSNS